MIMVSLEFNNKFICFIAWWTYVFVVILAQMDTSAVYKIVNIGVIVDSANDRSASINRSIDIAMAASNKTKYAKMFPIRENTNMDDSLNLRQTLCKLIEEQPVALIGTSKSDTFNVIESVSRALRVPFFLPSLAREYYPREENNYVIRMHPSYTDAFIDLIRYCNWNKIFYIYNTDDALWRLQKLYQAFEDRKSEWHRKHVVQIEPIHIPSIEDCRELLWKIDRNKSMPEKIFLVDLNSLEDYNRFMKQVIDVGMNKDGYHFLLGTLEIYGMDSDLWKSFTYGGVNVTGFQLVKASHRHGVLYQKGVADEDRQPPVEVALTVDAVAVLTTALAPIVNLLGFRRGMLYLHMNCSTDPVTYMNIGQQLLESILNVSLEGSNEGLSGKVAFDAFGYRKGYRLNIIHSSYMSPLHQVGYWLDGVGLKDMSLPSDREPIEVVPLNRTLIVTTIFSDPFVQMKASENGKPLLGNDRFEGFCVEMMSILAKRLNITYVLKLVKDDQFGSKDENGTWNGLIGELLRDEADIALASLTITRKRQEAVYFTKPFMSTGISIMIKKPEKEKPGFFSFMEPFSLEVWGCITMGFFAVSFLLYMVGRFSPYEWQEDEATGIPGPSEEFSFMNNLWCALGALLQQGPDAFPRSLSGRILASGWWFFTLIIISTYTANLAACLTFERLITPINSVDDLLKQSKIKYGVQKSGSTFDFFKESKVYTFQQMHKVMQSNPGVYVHDVEDGWKRVINERSTYAFMLESSSNNYYNQRKPCKTMKVGQNLDQKGYGLATRKGWPMSYDLNIAVLEMREKGDLMKLEQKWWYSKGQCGGVESGDKGKNGLNLSNVSGTFHILIGGLGLAVIITVSQLIFNEKIASHCNKDPDKLRERPLNAKDRVRHYSTFCDNQLND